MAKFKQVRRPHRLNKDADKTALKPEESPNIVHVRSTKLGAEQVLTPLIGTREIYTTFLTNNHKAIGAFRDDTQQTEIWFFYSSLGDHILMRYFPTSPTPAQILLRGSQLDLSLRNLITCCSIADNYLMFSDDYTYPKYVDMDKANRTNKKLSGSILFGKADGTANYVFPYNTAGVDYYFKVYDTAGTVIADELVYTSNLAVMNDPVAGVIEYADAFNANTTLNTLFTAKYCGCGEVEVNEIDASGTDTGLITTFETYFVNNTSPLLPTTQISVYNNIYPNDFDEFHIGRARRVPIKPADVTVGTDLDNTANLVQRINPQFAYRYIYTDNHYSTSNPISAIAIAPTDCSGRTGIGGNYREFDFTDEFTNPLAVDKGGILKIAKYLQEIKAVEILVRDNNINQFQIAYRIERCEFGINRQWWRFYNDLQRTALATTEEPTVKLFDAVPLTYKAETMGTLASGEQTRSYLSNTNEGYNPVCPDIRVKAQTTPNPPCSRLYNLTFWLEVYCPFQSQQNGLQCVWQDEGGNIVYGGMADSTITANLAQNYQQVLPEGGFTGYLVNGNSDYRATSTQAILTAFNGEYADIKKGILLGDTAGNRNGVWDAIKTQQVFQRFDLIGIPSGRYSFAVASNWVSKGDVLGKGVRYDLENGRAYQTTSMPIYKTSINTPNGITLDTCTVIQSEIIIDLPFDNGSYEAAQRNYAGLSIIDLSDPNLGGGANNTSTWAAQGYLVDANGSNSPSDLRTGLFVEGQTISVVNYAGENTFPGTQILQTDRNGFWFAASNHTGGGVIPIPIGDNPQIQIFDDSNSVAIKDFTDNAYLGGLNELDTETLASLTDRMGQVEVAIPGVLIYVKPRLTEFIAFTKSSTQRNSAAMVQVSVQDQNGNPVTGISVTLSSVGRAGYTNSLGVFEALKYSSVPKGYTTSHFEALLSQGLSCCIDLKTTLQAASLTCNLPVPFATPPNPNPILLPTSGAFEVEVFYDEMYATLKRGEQYTWAVVYYDNSKRSTTAEYTPNSSYYVPFWTQGTPNRDYYAFEWQIYSKPPSWATHFQILLARDRNYSRYVQTVLGKVSYFQRYKDTANNTPSSFAAGNATEIHLSLAPINTFNEQNKNSSVGYTYQQGDRLRFIQQATGQLWDTFVDVEITGMEGDAVIIQNNSDLIEITEGCLVELYSFRKTDNGEEIIFYEIGEVMPIIEDGGIRYHGKGSDFSLNSINIVAQDQSATNTYASGYINFGDTYLHNRSYQTNVNGLRQWSPLVESQNVSDFWESNSISIGRPNIWLPDKKNTDFPRVVRFSNPYSFSSGVNGLCSFEQLNRRDLDINLYEITYLTANLGYLVAIGKLGTASVYLGATQMVNQQEGFISLSSAVLGGYNILRPKDGRVMGTMHPQSIALVGGNPVCFNVQNGTVAMYTDGGIQILSDEGMRAEFLELANNLLPTDNVLAAYDSIYNEYTITIRDRRGQSYKSYVYSFNDNTRGWTQSLRYFPEGITGTSYGLTSYAFGTLWQHNTGAIGVFYGNFIPAEITLVFNDDAWQQKTHNVLSIETVYADITSGLVWEAPTKGDVWGNHPVSQTLMETRIKKELFERLFSRLWTYIPKDMNTPGVTNPVITGESMTCNVLNITLVNQNTNTFSTFAFICEGTIQT